MCGLCGVAGNYISKEHWNAFEQLLHCSAVRGWDASGVAGVFQDKEQVGWEVIKGVGSSFNLLVDKQFNTMYNRRFDLRAVIGHCRAATVGKNEQKNAHPFAFQHVVGAHNGTLNRRSPDQHKYETDSQALFADINARGVEVAIPDVSGAWALTWYDKFQNTLNFLRNDQRELFIAVLKHSDTIFWASESGLLEWVLRRMHFDVDTIVKLKPDLHVKWKLFEPKWLDTVEMAEVKGAPPVTYFRKEPSVPFVVEPKKESPPSSTTSSPPSNIVPLESREKKEKKSTTRVKFRKGWNGEQYDEPSYQAMLDKGCAYCSTVENARRPHRWISRDQYLCEECKDDWQFASTMVM